MDTKKYFVVSLTDKKLINQITDRANSLGSIFHNEIGGIFALSFARFFMRENGVMEVHDVQSELRFTPQYPKKIKDKLGNIEQFTFRALMVYARKQKISVVYIRPGSRLLKSFAGMYGLHYRSALRLNAIVEDLPGFDRRLVQENGVWWWVFRPSNGPKDTKHRTLFNRYVNSSGQSWQDVVKLKLQEGKANDNLKAPQDWPFVDKKIFNYMAKTSYSSIVDVLSVLIKQNPRLSMFKNYRLKRGYKEYAIRNIITDFYDQLTLNDEFFEDHIMFDHKNEHLRLKNHLENFKQKLRNTPRQRELRAKIRSEILNAQKELNAYTIYATLIHVLVWRWSMAKKNSNDAAAINVGLAADYDLGGIDLGRAKFDLKREGSRIDFNLPAADEATLSIPGLVPRIQSIVPVHSLPLLMGMAGDSDQEQLSMHK